MIFKRIKQEKHIKESMALENHIRSNFSEWSNNMQKKTDIFSIFKHDSSSSKVWVIWDLIQKMSIDITLCSFDFIYKNCPNEKKHINRLIAGSNYDIKVAQTAIIGYGLGIFRFAKFISNQSDMDSEQIGLFTSHLKLDSAKRQHVADESEAVFEDLKRRFRAHKKGATPSDAAIFYVQYLLDLCNLQLSDIPNNRSFLLSPEAEIIFEHNAMVAADGMAEVINGAFSFLYEDNFSNKNVYISDASSKNEIENEDYKEENDNKHEEYYDDEL